jgi:hypothetical protein
MIVSLLVEKDRPDLLRELSQALRDHYKILEVKETDRIGFRPIWTSETRGKVEAVPAVELSAELGTGQKWGIRELGERVKEIMRGHDLGELILHFGRYSEELRV